jgi:hypothetical protein
VAAGEGAGAAAARAVCECVGVRARPGARALTVRHAVTRYRITLDVFECTLAKGSLSACAVGAFAWKTEAELEHLAMPSAHRKIARAL